MIATIGFIGHSEIFRDVPTTYPYIESTIMFDRMSTLSIRSPWPMIRGFDCTGCGWFGAGLPIVANPSTWQSPITLNRLRLADDVITYPEDVFCYAPYGLGRTYAGDPRVPRGYPWRFSSAGFRSYYPYHGRGIGAYQFGSFSFIYPISNCNRERYQSGYLFQAAFPDRGLLDGSPPIRPASAYNGFGGSSVRAGRLFD